MKVLNYGSLNYDYVYEVDHINQPGETQSCVRRNVFCGGKGLNQSVALARAGVSVYQGGLTGEDGQMFLEVCRENGIDTSCLGRVIEAERTAFLFTAEPIRVRPGNGWTKRWIILAREIFFCCKMRSMDWIT